jgi:hypothetical protein
VLILGDAYNGSQLYVFFATKNQKKVQTLTVSGNFRLFLQKKTKNAQISTVLKIFSLFFFAEHKIPERQQISER